MNPFRLLLSGVCLTFLAALPHASAQLAPVSRQTAPLYIQSAADLSPLFTSLFTKACGEIENIQPIGNASGRGLFQSDLFPFGNAAGLVFSSGEVEMIDDSIIGQIPISGHLKSPGDIDLTTLTGYDVVDASGVQFDFTTFSDTIRLVYQFASEEYPEYNCTPWVDVIGIFLSGPGIQGPFSNNAINLATQRVNGTSIPVGINSINDGNLGILFNADSLHCQLPAGSLELSDLYVANPDETDLAMNGLTKKLEAVYAVTPGETYHLKIVVADGVDDVFDSALFLHAESLCGNTKLNPIAAAEVIRVSLDSAFFRNTSQFGQEYTWDFGDGTTSTLAEPKMHIYPGQGLYQGFLAVTNHCCTDTSFFTVPIFQPPYLNGASTRPYTCETPGKIELDVLSSYPFFCVWSNGAFTYDPSTQGLPPGEYSVEVTNNKGQTTVMGPFTVDTLADAFVGVIDTVLYPTCTDPATGVIVLVPPGPEEQYTYTWEHDPDLHIWVAEELAAGAYHVTVKDADGCRREMDILLEDTGPVIDQIVTMPPLCAGGKSGTLSLQVVGPTPPFVIDVLNQSTAKLKFPPYQLNAGQYRVFVKDAKGCKTTHDFVLVDPPAMQIDLLIGLDADGQPTILIPKVSQGKPPYSFLWSDGSTSASRSDLSPGIYQVTVTDGKGCTQLKEIKYGIPGGGVIGNGGLQIDPIPGGVMLRFEGYDSSVSARTVSLVDILGRKVSLDPGLLSSGPVFIPIHQAGIYTIEVMDNTGKRFSRMVIIH
ncbi:MAG: PKD domain-containing protein [Saprospiraceae bacterium]|nr:PKD domain-containing protein [Saprospiraceae bacterium]